VLLDEKAVLSCMTLTVECEGQAVRTIEGLSDPKTGKLDPLQQAFIDHTAFQCGFCTPGMIMSSTALLRENPSPWKKGKGSPVGKLLPLHQPLPGGEGHYGGIRKGG